MYHALAHVRIWTCFLPQVGSKLHDYIEEINMLYPPEIVQCPHELQPWLSAISWRHSKGRHSHYESTLLSCRQVLLTQLRRDPAEEDGGGFFWWVFESLSLWVFESLSLWPLDFDLGLWLRETWVVTMVKRINFWFRTEDPDLCFWCWQDFNPSGWGPQQPPGGMPQEQKCHDWDEEKGKLKVLDTKSLSNWQFSFEISVIPNPQSCSKSESALQDLCKTPLLVGSKPTPQTLCTEPHSCFDQKHINPAAINLFNGWLIIWLQCWSPIGFGFENILGRSSLHRGSVPNSLAKPICQTGGRFSNPSVSFFLNVDPFAVKPRSSGSKVDARSQKTDPESWLTLIQACQNSIASKQSVAAELRNEAVAKCGQLMLKKPTVCDPPRNFNEPHKVNSNHVEVPILQENWTAPPHDSRLRGAPVFSPRLDRFAPMSARVICSEVTKTAGHVEICSTNFKKLSVAKYPSFSWFCNINLHFEINRWRIDTLDEKIAVIESNHLLELVHSNSWTGV